MYRSKLLGLAGWLLLTQAMSGVTRADTLSPTGDTYTNNGSAGTNYNAGQPNGGGIVVKYATRRDGWIKFAFGTVAVTEAKLWVYQTNVADQHDIEVRASQYDFNESTLTAGNAPDANGWPYAGQWYHTSNTPQWYALDITSIYNANVGKIVTFRLRSTWQSSDVTAPTFEDRENSKGSGNSPYVETSGPLDCVMGVSPATDVYRGVFGADPVQNVVYTVTSNGTNPMNWTVQKVPDDAGTAWLMLDKSGGGPLANGQSDVVTAMIATSGLADGRHVCQLQFTNDCSPPVTETRIVTLDYSATSISVSAAGDTFTQSGAASTNFNGQSIYVKYSSRRDGWIEFDTGPNPVTLAELWMYQTLAACDAQIIELRGKAYSFNEATLTWNTQPNADSWQLLGTWNAPSGNRWYSLNIADFYNANLNARITMRVRCIWQGSDATGQKFEDRDNSLLSGNTPYIKRGSEVVCGSSVSPAGSQGVTVPRNQPPSPSSFQYTVTNLGEVGLDYTVQKDPDDAGTAWLSLDKVGGSIAAEGSDQVTATIVSTDLSDGLHSVDVVFTDNCNPTHVHRRTIQLSIIACQTQVTPAEDQYRTVIGTTGLSNSVEYTISEKGGDPLSYTVQKIPDDATTAWLTLNKVNGGPLAYGQTDQVTAFTNANGLAPGYYSCDLRFTNDCAPSVSVVRTVHLRVLPRGGTLVPNDDSYGDSSEVGTGHDDRGILIKQERRRDGWLEFTLGSSPVRMAKLFMYQTLATCDPQTIELNGAEYAFDEVTLTFNNQPAASSWAFLGSWNAPSGNRWYDVDITDFYNENLNKTVTIRMLVTSQDSDYTGQLFEDRENTLGTGNTPYIDPEVTPWPDVDKDGDADLADFAEFQRCYAINGLQSAGTGCSRFDRDHDGDIDLLDFGQFQNCATGPALPLDPDNLPTGCEL